MKMGDQKQTGTHWLDRYASQYHRWQQSEDHLGKYYYRPLGAVESLFDADGTEFEGRADVNVILTLEVRSTLTKAQFRKRVQLAWASLRMHHALLLARALSGHVFLPQCHEKAAERLFVIEQPKGSDQAMDEALGTMAFLEDDYPNVQSEDFFLHCMNSARVFDPSQHLAKMFVMPLRPLPGGTYRFEAILIAAHQITDGLSVYQWMAHFMCLLNQDEQDLERGLARACLPENLWQRLPPAQEDLYSEIAGDNRALQRWRWAITRILRHVRHPPPPCFPNPLRRHTKLTQAVPLPPKYPQVLNYARTPPLNTITLCPKLSPSATHRLQSLCRSANVSIGSGCFALVGLTIMEIYEQNNPSAKQHLPFVGSFPLNPRHFFSHTAPADSLMLAFSDGLTLPFLPSHLPLEGRFRLLAKHAHRQLSLYQKNPRNPQTVTLGSRSPAQVLPMNYIGCIERLATKFPPHLRSKHPSPQGAYPAREDFGTATCGVSSTGSRAHILTKGMYALDAGNTSFAADFRDLGAFVRARDNEFLVGSVSDADTLVFGVSYDGNAIDEVEARRWGARIEGIFEGGGKL